MSESGPVIVDTAIAAAGVDADQPPAWFRRGKPKRSKTSTSKVVPKIKVAEQDEDLPWQERWRRWLIGFAGMGYGASFLVHVAILLVMWLIMIGGMTEREAISTVAFESEEDPMTFDEIVDTRMDLDALQPDEAARPDLQPPPLVFNSEMNLNFDKSINDLLGNKGDSDILGGGMKFAMPAPGKAVSKGSFTAWTVPEDPRPGQDYVIIIQIKLPRELRRYPRSDLSGNVVGTDGYRQTIPEPATGHLAVRDSVSQLVVPVPGAAKLVKDKIEVESKMLKERQTLEIVF